MFSAKIKTDVQQSAGAARHWNGAVWFALEEPMSGDNVGRTVTKFGVQAMRDEFARAHEFLGNVGERPFKDLLALPPLKSVRQILGKKGNKKEKGEGKQGPDTPSRGDK